MVHVYHKGAEVIWIQLHPLDLTSSDLESQSEGLYVMKKLLN